MYIVAHQGGANLINLDGIEWSIAKWRAVAKTWFWLNDWAGCWWGNQLVADHPKIKEHLSNCVRENKITMIPYGADAVIDVRVEVLRAPGLEAGQYVTVIAHDNQFNRWVAGESARYFCGAEECSDRLDDVLQNPSVLGEMKAGILQRYKAAFAWEKVLAEYEALLVQWLPNREKESAL
ncbi:MAG: DUF1972 domain-containing protein [Methylococcales bacterium]|nr:DUF1972 domain-containing protein [Methylococcales bacterium]